MIKKIFIYGSALLFVVLISLTSCKNETSKDDDVVFPLTYSLNYQQTFGQPFKVSFSKGKDIREIELFLNDSLLKKWTSFSTTIEETFDISKLGLGAKAITIKVKDKSGNEFVENQTIHVLSNIEPEYLKAETVELFPHNPEDFTQGFEIVNGILYESTGDPDHKGATRVMRKELKTGKVLNETSLDGNYFGEGITVFNNLVYQITWTSQKCFTYNAETLEKKPTNYNYTGEGWGLTNDGKNIIMTDGSERIYFRDPSSFVVRKIISVYDNKGAIKNLNEIEYVDGLIYANVWMTNKIVVIDASTGKVLKNIDCSDFESKAKGSGDVLNGIAYDKQTKNFYLTGKYWSYVGRVEFK
jgi:glutamine cyclotransferase